MINIDTAMVIELEKQAINYSLKGKYKKAIKINKKILKLQPNNLATLNRLARSYFLNNNLNNAKKYYQQVLKLDQYNIIAQKNLSLIKKNHKIKKEKKINNNGGQNCYEFLEIPGKTQTVSLTRLTEADNICQLKIGQMVSIAFKKRSIQIYIENCYIGTIPDDVSQRLLLLANKGNKYQAYVKAINEKKVYLFVKEVFQGKRSKDMPSFPATLL